MRGHTAPIATEVPAGVAGLDLWVVAGGGWRVEVGVPGPLIGWNKHWVSSLVLLPPKNRALGRQRRQDATLNPKQDQTSCPIPQSSGGNVVTILNFIGLFLLYF